MVWAGIERLMPLLAVTAPKRLVMPRISMMLPYGLLENVRQAAKLVAVFAPVRNAKSTTAWQLVGQTALT
jgi:hypothetical protein